MVDKIFIITAEHRFNGIRISIITRKEINKV
jgi:hypothetical protein